LSVNYKTDDDIDYAKLRRRRGADGKDTSNVHTCGLHGKTKDQMQSLQTSFIKNNGGTREKLPILENFDEKCGFSFLEIFLQQVHIHEHCNLDRT